MEDKLCGQLLSFKFC